LRSAEPSTGAGGSRRQYCFAEFTLDLDAGFLRRRGEEVALSPKAFEILACLIQHHGRLVTKDALIEAVWPDTAITDNSLAQRLLEIRRALADDSQQIVRTVARRGYVFAAPVTSPVMEFPRQAGDTAAEPGLSAVPPAPPGWRGLNRKALAGVLAGLAVVAGGLLLARRLVPREKPDLTYTQITNFTDSAVAPALSPDGRMVAFYRSAQWFLTPDPIYVKLLPDGEPVQISGDPRPKYGLAFSPDGSRIAYTVGGWNTYTVSPLGGESRLLLSNAAGLGWLDKRLLLFSEIRTGLHMGIVTATESRSEYRRIYFPQDERRMAHYSYPSPDRKWVLVVEMDPVWQPCRVVPMDGSSLGRPVGPQGKCTSAAWSPDGKWMYLGVEVDGNQHLWRQRFPSGEPEQITSGPTDEAGIAVAPDGRSLITSIGMRLGAVWIHDAQGERSISSEGYVPTVEASGLFGTRPAFSQNGKQLYYLNRDSPGAPIELWQKDLESGKSERLLPGMSILEYDVSRDGKEVVFSTQPTGSASQLWLAPLNRSAPPRLIASSGEASPHFGPDGWIVFRQTEGKTHFLARMQRDGSGRSKAVPYPIGNIQSISHDQRWVAAFAPLADGGSAAMALPVDGGAPRGICHCYVAWAPDGKFLYLGLERSSRTSSGKTLAIPIPPGKTLPDLPASGIRGLSDATLFPGSRVIDGWALSPGPDPSTFVYVKTTVHRNLFRIPLNSR
jgi:DNA-binding winged helix-turn-helix (wHTH) protein/Tol biopolymer transport system component